MDGLFLSILSNRHGGRPWADTWLDFHPSICIRAGGHYNCICFISYTIYRKMSFLFLLLCKIVEFVSRSNVYMSFVQFFHCIGSNIYWLSGSKCNTCSFWKIWKIEKNEKRKINMVYNFTIQNHCIIFKSWCYQKRTNLRLQFFKDNVAC